MGRVAPLWHPIKIKKNEMYCFENTHIYIEQLKNTQHEIEIKKKQNIISEKHISRNMLKNSQHQIGL